MPLQIDIDRDKLADFCRRHHIIRLSVFGSVLRDDFGPNSDVDFLYVFHPDHHPGWDIMDVEEELSRLVGRKVDFVPERYLKPRVRARVEHERAVVFEDEHLRQLVPTEQLLSHV